MAAMAMRAVVMGTAVVELTAWAKLSDIKRLHLALFEEDSWMLTS